MFDRSTIGHVGKHSYCIAGQEDEMAWAPLHVERGLTGETSAVTVFAALGSQLVSNHFSPDPEGICRSIADVMAGGAHRPRYYAGIVGRDHRAVLERAGWDKRRVRECLAAEAYRTVGEMIRKGALPPDAGSADTRSGSIRSRTAITSSSSRPAAPVIGRPSARPGALPAPPCP